MCSLAPCAYVLTLIVHRSRSLLSVLRHSHQAFTPLLSSTYKLENGKKTVEDPEHTVEPSYHHEAVTNIPRLCSLASSSSAERIPPAKPASEMSVRHSTKRIKENYILQNKITEHWGSSQACFEVGATLNALLPQSALARRTGFSIAILPLA